jgi:hypothetical protein
MTVTWLAFRKHPQVPVARQEHIKAYALQVAEQQTWLEEILNVASPATLPSPRPVSTVEEAEQAAHDLRNAWNLRQICPRAVTTPLGPEPEAKKAIHDARAVLALPRSERDRVLAAAATDAATLYEGGAELTGFDAMS